MVSQNNSIYIYILYRTGTFISLMKIYTMLKLNQYSKPSMQLIELVQCMIDYINLSHLPLFFSSSFPFLAKVG